MRISESDRVVTNQNAEVKNQGNNLKAESIRTEIQSLNNEPENGE